MILADRDYRLMEFKDAFGACNFIVTWDGNDVNDLFGAINFARQEGDRFIQEKLIEYILNIPVRNPRPKDIPAFVGRPVWAVDKQDRALIGMPGSEAIVPVSLLRKIVTEEKVENKTEVQTANNGTSANGKSLTMPETTNTATPTASNGVKKKRSKHN
jgi:hypothetical protein